MHEVATSRRAVMRSLAILPAVISAPAATPKKSRPKGKAKPACDLLPRIDRACVQRGIGSSRFGRRAVNDPRLVEDIRNGRAIRSATRIRIEAYLRRLEWLASMKGEA